MNTELITDLLNRFMFVDLHPVYNLGDVFANLIGIFQAPNPFADFLVDFSVALPVVLDAFHIGG